MDKHAKNTILATRDDLRREQQHNASGRKERMERSEQSRKQDLGRARLQQRLERSCWKTNNKKNNLDMVL